MPFTLILWFEGDDGLNLLEHSYQIDRKLQNIIAPSSQAVIAIGS